MRKWTRRVIEKPIDPAIDWKPHTTPGFEINGLGQLRTTGPQQRTALRPLPKKEPAVTEGHVYDWADYGC